MASKKKSKGDLSRRIFIKTTTAATAAASVGIMPSFPRTQPLSSTDGVRQPAWEITDREIQTIWTEIWPKIVALAWKDPTYRNHFESSAAFRIVEARRIAGLIGVDYTSNIPICITSPAALNIGVEEFVSLFTFRERSDQSTRPTGWTCEDTLYGDTYFLINTEGFVMPWPDKPSRGEVFIGYFEGGGVLPRNNPTRPPAEQARINNISTGWIPPTNLSSPGCTLAGLSGVALFTLFDKWSKIVALAWDNPAQIPDIQGDPQKYIMPEVWSQWPDIVTASVDQALVDIKLVHGLNQPIIELVVPLPNPPATGDNIFEELIAGYASNPMYSNCY